MSCELSEIQSDGIEPKTDPESGDTFDTVEFDFSDDEKPSSKKCKDPKRRVKRLKGSNRTYGLRPRDHLRRPSYDFEADDKDKDPSFSRKDSRHRIRSPVGTKCRRLTANARERQRMKEINDAFTTLRGVLPSFHSRPSTRVSMTKIRTLRLASSYIQGLSDLLSGAESVQLNSYSENLRKHFESLQNEATASTNSEDSPGESMKMEECDSGVARNEGWHDMSASDEELFNLLENEVLSIKHQQNNNNEQNSDLNWNEDLIQLGCN